MGLLLIGTCAYGLRAPVLDPEIDSLTPRADVVERFPTGAGVLSAEGILLHLYARGYAGAGIASALETGKG